MSDEPFTVRAFEQRKCGCSGYSYNPVNAFRDTRVSVHWSVSLTLSLTSVLLGGHFFLCQIELDVASLAKFFFIK